MKSSSPLTPGQIRSLLASLPRTRLAHLPTPLEELPRLTKELGGPRILAKREDMTGLAYGGNKARHYEYQMPHIQQEGFDTIVNVMDYHSNNARMTAAAAVKTGMDYVLVLTNAVEGRRQGNLLISKLLCKEIHLLDRFRSQDAMEYASEVKVRLEGEGKRPYLVQEHLFPKLAGMIAYVGASLELMEQCESLGLRDVHVIGVAGRSLCGLATASVNLGLGWKFTGVQVTYSPTLDEYIFDHAEDIRELLKLPRTFGREDIAVLDQYVGEGYGIMTAECAEAIHIAARTEGLMCDPNYTGTVMAAMIDQIRNGNFDSRETLIMLHTGGLPGIFAFGKQLGRL